MIPSTGMVKTKKTYHVLVLRATMWLTQRAVCKDSENEWKSSAGWKEKEWVGDKLQELRIQHERQSSPLTNWRQVVGSRLIHRICVEAE